MGDWLSGSRSRAAVLFVILLAMSGCQSAPALPTEDRVADFAAIKSKASAIEMTTSRVPLEGTRGRELEMAIHESKPASTHRTIVFIHGVFSDSRMWRYLYWDMADEYRIMAVDLLGCGESDQPDPIKLGPGGYSPSALGRDVLLALRQRLSELPKEDRLTLVGHSLGAMTILNMWADPLVREEFADVLDRVDTLVLLAPPDITADCRTETFKEIDRMDDFRMTLVDVLGILKRRVTLATRESVADPSLATREEAERTIDILRDRSTRRAGQAMLRQAIPKSKDRCQEIAAGYANIKASCLIIWGAQDDVFPTSMGQKLVDRLPNAKLSIVNSAMHGLATERPAACANLMREFVAGKGAPAAAERPTMRIAAPKQSSPNVTAISTPAR
jgi:pimeloyl-ACP methyl ester carboxylesterase